ncbi:hypothetical protein C0J52_05958 [Blattella germanica]|nr:hypothetical protein C0J52_05958 [Blattella germanica]
MSSEKRTCATNREAACLLNKMDNEAYERECKSTVEMGAMTPSNGNGIPTCNEMCISLHKQHQKSLQEYNNKSAKSSSEDSPWHRLKTIFLVSIIAILIIWIIVYTILSQLDIV